MAEPQAHRPYSLRRLLSLLNSLVAASGVILIGLGVGIKYGEAALTRVLGPASTYHLHISHLCLGLGCLAVLLALVGWCIAKKESRGSLLFFLVTMAVILVVEITVASVVLAFFPVLKCSGVNNYTDFPSSSFSMVTGHSYPRGCCKSLGAMACDGHNVSSSVIHQAGCFHRLLKITKTQSYTLNWVSLGMALMQLPGVLATLLLYIKLG